MLDLQIQMFIIFTGKTYGLKVCATACTTTTTRHAPPISNVNRQANRALLICMNHNCKKC